MHYVYHGVPPELVGTKLFPLNMLEKEAPDVYDQQRSKYKGREEVSQRQIPELDCTWADVVQLLPLHPRKVFEAQREMNAISELPEYTYLKIPLSQLDPSRTFVYFKTAPGEKYSRILPIDQVDFDAIQEVPPSTLVYYYMSAQAQTPAFNYQFIPHVLYKGEIDISDTEIVNV